MRKSKRPFVFELRNTKFCSCSQTAIPYFTLKYEISQLHSNGQSFFCSKMENFETTETAMSFFFFTKHKNFENCTKTTVRLFYNETENIESCTQTYGSHLSHIFEKPSISIEKPSFSIE